MAERGALERLFGGDDIPGEAAEPQVAPLDPAAAALAFGGSEVEPALARDAADYFRKQARLVDIQTEHLHEQREVQLSHLRLRRFADRLKVGLQIFIILAATVLGLGGAVMLYDAFASRSVVVEAFKAPAALAGRGLTGDVVASGLLDKLQTLRDATRASSKGLKTKGAWSSDIKIEAPGTGVSIGEVDRLLHERFGHDVHIGGDLVQTDDGGLALTVRGDRVPAKTFTGAASDLEWLTTSAAEYVYGRAEPVRYANYLLDTRRYADALAYLPGAFANSDNDSERARLANMWGNIYAGINQPAEAIAKYRLVLTLAAPYSKVWWTAHSNLIGEVGSAEGEEAAWREGHAMLLAAAKAPQSTRPERRIFQNPAQFTWDVPLMLAALTEEAKRNHGAGSFNAIVGPAIADVHALMHDPAASAREMAFSDPEDPTTKAESLLLQGYAALDRGDAAGAVPPLEAFYKAWEADPALQEAYDDNACFLGLAYGFAGRQVEAGAVFKRMTRPWSRCYAFQGDVLAHLGDVAGAQRAWAEGVRLTPDLPNVYLHRGRFEADRHNFNGAEADFSTANAKAPHFADPLKAWGDLLASEGRWREAVAKYDEALKYAPAWAELHRARGAAAARRR